MIYETAQCMAGGALVFLIVVAVIWLTSGGNGANVPPEKGDGIIRSDTPYHQEYATQEAARLTEARIGGHNLGEDMHVYVSTDEADYHSQSRHIAWMLEDNRAAKVGVHVHKVSAAERDRISAMRGSGSQVWHSTAETEAPGVTETHSGGMSDGAKLAIGLLLFVPTFGTALVAIIMLLAR